MHSSDKPSKPKDKRLKRSRELEERYYKVINSLSWSMENAKEFVDDFNQTLQEAVEERGKGIAFGESNNSIPAIDSYFGIMPTGDEKGNSYAVDFSGNVVRAICVNLKGKGEQSVVQRALNVRKIGISTKTPFGLLDANTTASTMFDVIAKLVKDVMLEVGDNPADKVPIAFTFSFPVVLKALDIGILSHWTKEFETGRETNDPVEGQNVSALLNSAFRRNFMGAFVLAIVNDTCGTLVSAGYESNQHMPTVRLGVILCSGFNIAAYDPSASHHGYSGTILNYECGSYSGTGKYFSPMDKQLDFRSSHPGRQFSEKIIGAQYLGELCRLSILETFQYRCSQNVWVPWSFSAEQAVQIYGDNTKRYRITQQILLDELEWNVTCEEMLRYVYKLVCAVFDRSATIAGLMTAVVANRTRFLQRGLGGVTVAVDGSLYLRNVKYRKTYRAAIDKILEARSDLLHLVSATDGSGKGAAVISACQAAS